MSIPSLLLVPWMLLPGAAGCPHHQDKKPEAKVKVTVVVILASDRCPYVHPRLKAIAAELQKGDPSLTGFTLVSMTAKSLAVNQKAKFHCVEDCHVEVVIHQCVDQANKVCLAVTAPLQGEVVYRCVCDKFLPIVTRYQTRQRIPPHYVALAIGHMCSGSPAQRMLALETLKHGRCCDRLILAICVKPCDGK
jgi:hypothetical protein